jgi:hypothetical protein
MFGKKTPSEEELREELTETIREEVREELRKEMEDHIEVGNKAYDKGYFMGTLDAKTKYEAVDRVKQQEERLVRQDPNMNDMSNQNVTYEESNDRQRPKIRRDIGGICHICTEFLIEGECPNVHNHGKYTKNKYD